ncbi:SOS response-associated peptidase [Bdellovibrionota bacterium FG-2]
MCGRAYHTYTEEELEARYLNERSKRNPLGFTKNFNLAPTQDTPIVVQPEGAPEIKMARFGLIPFWAKDAKTAEKYRLINARGEEISTKRSYKNAFINHRCIVTLTGFFEWKRGEDGGKRPFAIHLKTNSIMSVAGVWENESFSIITIGANSMMAKIHDRMPVILDPKDEAAWLNPEEHSLPTLEKFLKPCPSSWLESYEISPLVNSPKNNREEVLRAVASR